MATRSESYGIRALVRKPAVALVRSALRLWPRSTATRRVLFVCSRELQVDYLAEVWDILKADPRLEFRMALPLTEPVAGAAERVRRVLPLKEVGVFWAYSGQWDVAILADHVLEGLVADEQRRIIRISHGFPGKISRRGLYAFGPGAYGPNGRIRYSRMFVPSRVVKEWAVRQDPAFADVVAVVGSPGDDRMLAQTGRRREYRSRYGFKPEDIVVFVTGTWGPHSLFQSMGDALLAQARRLQGDFRFILSTHSLEYRPRPAPERVWGQYLREQSQHGFVVREPSESWVPYMIASDILLTDHTSLALHGALLGLPFVCAPVPDDLVEAGTVIRQIRDISPTIRPDASDLRQALLQAHQDYPLDKLQEIAAQMNSCPRQSVERMRTELYTQLSLSPWTGQVPTEPAAAAAAAARSA